MNFNNSFTKYLREFVPSYEGPKLSVVATGGGIAISDIAKIPGSSKVLHGIYLPYETAETKSFINDFWHSDAAEEFEKKCVCQEASESLLHALEERNHKNGHDSLRNISITAAIQTNRYRRGQNHAFISFRKKSNNITVTWHLKMSKLEEPFFQEPKYYIDHVCLENRVKEDELIAQTALCLATGFLGNGLFEEKVDLEFIERKIQDGTLTEV